MTRMLLLYRPRLPGQRAQAIQVLHAAEAMARRGGRVTVLADRASGDATPRAALTALGLAPVDGLDLRLAPVGHKGLAGVWFRAQLRRWALGPPGVVLARDLRRLVAAARLWRRHRVVLEVHGLESTRSNAAADAAAIERQALALAHAVVANCEGTAEAWRRAHSKALPPTVRVAHNAVAPHRRRDRVRSDGRVRAVGSLRRYKGWSQLLAAADPEQWTLELVGGTASELAGPVPAGVVVRPPAPYPDVPDLLARSAALVLPLADNSFGRARTSPLKLFDYLATAVPLVLPDLAAVHDALASAGAASSGLFWYTPGRPDSLRSAIAAAVVCEPRRPTVRTWDDRLDGLASLLRL